MSISVMTRVWANSRRKGVELLIELALADFADDQGRCWPAVETIAGKARCSVRYVQDTCKSMQADGDLEILEGLGPHGTNLYTLVSEGVHTVHPSSPREGVHSGATSRKNGGASFPIRGAKRRRQSAPDPSGSVKDPSLTVNEPKNPISTNREDDDPTEPGRLVTRNLEAGAVDASAVDSLDPPMPIRIRDFCRELSKHVLPATLIKLGNIGPREDGDRLILIVDAGAFNELTRAELREQVNMCAVAAGFTRGFRLEKSA